MKKRLIPLVMGLVLGTVTSGAYAESLMDVYQAAVKNDPTTLKAKANRDATYAAIGQSKASLLPSLSLSLSFNKNKNEDISDEGVRFTRDSESTSGRLSLSQSLYNANFWIQLDQAERRASQSDANYGNIQQTLIVRTVNAYFDVLKAMDDLEFAIAEKAAVERQLQQTNERYKVGLTAVTALREAQAQFDSAIASEIQAQNNVEVRREALREITGQYHGDIDILNKERFSATNPSPNNVEGWLTMAERSNLQLLASKISVDIAKKDIELAQAGHLPTLSLSASTSSGSSDSGNISGPTLDSSSIGLTFSMPLYKGGATSAGVERAQHSFVAASEDREATHRSVVRSVRSNYLDVMASIASIQAFEKSVVSAEHALRATELGHEVGTRTIVDVLNSTRNLFSAKRNLAGARYNYIKSVVALKQATGTLDEAAVQDINRGLTAASK